MGFGLSGSAGGQGCVPGRNPEGRKPAPDGQNGCPRCGQGVVRQCPQLHSCDDVCKIWVSLYKPGRGGALYPHVRRGRQRGGDACHPSGIRHDKRRTGSGGTGARAAGLVGWDAGKRSERCRFPRRQRSHPQAGAKRQVDWPCPLLLKAWHCALFSDAGRGLCAVLLPSG